MIGFSSVDYLALFYALAGLLGAIFNIAASGRSTWNSRPALGTYITGFLIGLLWQLQPLIEFSDKTSLLARLGVVFALAFFSVDTARNLMARRFSLNGGADKPAEPDAAGNAAPATKESPMRVIALLLMPLLLAACSTGGINLIGEDRVQNPLSDLRAFVREDVTQALAFATAATDSGAPYRARCFSTLLKAIPEAGPAAPAPNPKGLVSAFELAAELAARVRAKGDEGLVSEAVQADCAYIVDELRRFVLRSGAKLAPIPGAGAAGGLLLR